MARTVMLLVAGAFLVAGCGEDELAVGVEEVCDLFDGERDADGVALQEQLARDHDGDVAALVDVACGPAAAAAADRESEREAEREAERQRQIAEAAEERAREAEEEERRRRAEERRERVAERERERQATAWVPRGFVLLTQDLAVNQVGDIVCRSGTRCIHYEVVSRSGCSRVYFEVNLLDANGRVIGWTNDTLGALAAGQVGLLEFSTRDAQVSSLEITESRCHR